jgi:hypothetical protein
MSELNPPGFKKRTTKVNKLSPLNPLHLQKQISSDSPPLSPLGQTFFVPSGDESSQSSTRKKSIGVVLRRVTTNQSSSTVINNADTMSVYSNSSRNSDDKKVSKGNTPLATPFPLHYLPNLVTGEEKTRVYQEPKSHLLFRSASLGDIPQWSTTFHSPLSATNTPQMKSPLAEKSKNARVN